MERFLQRTTGRDYGDRIRVIEERERERRRQEKLRLEQQRQERLEREEEIQRLIKEEKRALIKPEKSNLNCYRCWRKLPLFGNFCAECDYTIRCLPELDIDKDDIQPYYNAWEYKKINLPERIVTIIKKQQEKSLFRIDCKDCWLQELSSSHRGYRDFCFNCMKDYRCLESKRRCYVLFKEMPPKTKAARTIIN